MPELCEIIAKNYINLNLNLISVIALAKTIEQNDGFITYQMNINLFQII
ncbi:hypothetical protein ZPR_0376 [Zunongwangia profunda SM-A87]|uniref:Uncharacterized protein n=1 Tax=Zunongwangia profunda (strain DSM 18752 / CCTCC AB 206139 / SM-A87) TaxID=655815 RepID=D5BDZ4_ZUNPS|nr:hypothetical protein ZPR_0376 [Zunongwangia profunda SM-A87]